MFESLRVWQESLLPKAKRGGAGPRDANVGFHDSRLSEGDFLLRFL